MAFDMMSNNCFLKSMGSRCLSFSAIFLSHGEKHARSPTKVLEVFVLIR